MVARMVRDHEVVGSNPVASTKPRIRAHLAPFLHDLDCGHLHFSKLPCPHIRKNAICNPSARFGGQFFSPNLCRRKAHIGGRQMIFCLPFLLRDRGGITERGCKLNYIRPALSEVYPDESRYLCPCFEAVRQGDPSLSLGMTSLAHPPTPSFSPLQKEVMRVSEA